MPPVATRSDDDATEYGLIASLVFRDRRNAERAEKDLAASVFNGPVRAGPRSRK